MSQDVYELDRHKHGGVHVDRYNRQGTLVGRYQPDRTPIKHKGKFPQADFEKFANALAGKKAK